MKSLFEQMGGTYREENGYLIPNLSLPDEEQVEIGVWGQRHLRYIKQHHKVLYTNLLTSGKLNGYLADLDKQAEDMYQIEWVARMNNIRCRATEIVNNDIIYT